LFASITAVHLATVVGAVRAGGHGILAVDALGSRKAPGLLDVGEYDDEALRAFVEKERAGGAVLDPDPDELMARLRSPGLKGLVDSPQLEGPWMWKTGDTLAVYGLVFRRR
jgi:hypothetical protein